MACPFCPPEPHRVLCSNTLAIAFRDNFPVSEGHCLVIPRAHYESIFQASPAEQQALWEMVAEVRKILDSRFHPDAFNIGVNDGPAAGQTVPHGHIHVIPRYTGDVEDPRGGIRHVIPAKASYWQKES